MGKKTNVIYFFYILFLLNSISIVDATITYDGTKILIHNGTENISSINQNLKNNSILEQETTKVWILKRPIIVKNTGILDINSSDCNWLKLQSLNDNNTSYIENQGILNISNTTITSWNMQNNDFAPKTDTKRAYIYSHGTQILLNSCNLSYLGSAGSYGLWGVCLYGDKNGARITNTKFYNNFKGLSIDEDNVYIYDSEVYNSSDKGITIAHFAPVKNLWMEKVESHLSPNGCPIHVKYWSTGGVHNATLIDVDAHHGNGSQIHFSSARDSKLIRVKAHDSGWYYENETWQNGAGVLTDEKPVLTENTHSGLDLHTDAYNIYIEDFEGWNVENAIYIHNADENITVKNSTAHDSFGGFNIQGGNKNITLENCTAHNIGFGEYYQGAGFNIHSSRDIVIRNSTVTGSLFGARILPYIWEDPKFGNNTENITFENNTFYDQVGPSYYNFMLYQDTPFFKNIQIINQQEHEFELRRNFLYEPPYPLEVTIKYGDGRFFKMGNEWAPIYPNGSCIVYTLNKHTLVNTYDIFAIPNSSKVETRLNEFNTTLPLGNILVNFTLDSSEVNNIIFNIAKLQPNHYYTIKRDGVNVTKTQADSSGNIQFESIELLEHTFTVEETSSAYLPTINISPSSNTIFPGETFALDLLVNQSTPISGIQLDFIFNSSKTSVNNVTEGNLLKQSGAYTLFSNGTTNNSAGTVKNIYGFILGTSNVSSPGTMATVNLTAGSKTGIAEFSLSNVLISGTDSKSVPYTVTNATVLIDTAPVMSAICCPKSVDEKSTLTFKVSAKDADGDRLVLSASGLPEGSSFNRTSGAFTWTPSRGQAGVYTLTFEVSDGYLTDSENVTITVNRLNNPPLISSFEPLEGSSFSEGERIRISVNASDSEGQALNYSLMIDGVVCSTGTEYIWETDYSSSGNHTIGVTVSDGIDTIKGQRTIYISECRPRWDVDENGMVNILDVTSVSQKYGTTISKPYPRYDINQDGAVNILDLTLVGNHFGEIVN